MQRTDLRLLGALQLQRCRKAAIGKLSRNRKKQSRIQRASAISSTRSKKAFCADSALRAADEAGRPPGALALTQQREWSAPSKIRTLAFSLTIHSRPRGASSSSRRGGCWTRSPKFSVP